MSFTSSLSSLGGRRIENLVGMYMFVLCNFVYFVLENFFTESGFVFFVLQKIGAIKKNFICYTEIREEMRRWKEQRLRGSIFQGLMSSDM